MGPDIRFVSEEIDLGDVRLFEYKDVEIEFENTGDSPLCINRVIPICSCITITKSVSVIKSHEKGCVRFKYHGARQGKSNFEIAVISNDPERPNIILRGVVFVDSGITALPKIDLGVVPEGAHYKREMPIIITSPDKTVEISEIRVSSTLINGEIAYDDYGNPKLIIEGSIGNKGGEYHEAIHIFGDKKDVPLYSTQIVANVIPGCFVVPKKLQFRINNALKSSMSRVNRLTKQDLTKLHLGVESAKCRKRTIFKN